MDVGDRQRQQLREAVEACRARIVATGLTVREWLDYRWDELNAQRLPGWTHRDVSIDSDVVDGEVRWIPVEHVIQGLGELRWGAIGYRQDSFVSIVHGLLDTPADTWIDAMGVVSLLQHDGPHGPTYSVCTDGNHRVHAMKALDLPVIQACVEHREEQPVVGAEVNAWDRQHVRLLRDLGFVRDLRRSSFSTSGILAYELEVPWALEPPDYVWRISRGYADVYPRFRDHPFFRLTSSAEAAASLEYLTAYAPTLPAAEAPQELHQREPVRWRRWAARMLRRR